MGNAIGKLGRIYSKGFKKLKIGLIKPISYYSVRKYMHLYTKELAKDGMNINGKPFFIATDVHFDGSDYGLITIGDNVTISSNVKLLTHDQSILVPYRMEGEFFHGFKYDTIEIGENSFIGMNAILLQGTKIGKNSIVGAGAVVKGNFPDNCIIAGNPARIVENDIMAWHERKINNPEEIAKVKKMYIPREYRNKDKQP